MTLRPATPADAAAIAALSGELGYAASAEEMAARLSRILPQDGHLVLVALGERGEPVGWIHAAEQEVLEAGFRCTILGLVVGERARRGGVGRGLVAAVEAWAAGRGHRDVTVRSAVPRAESHPFYLGLGYERVKTQHVYRKRLG